MIDLTRLREITRTLAGAAGRLEGHGDTAGAAELLEIARWLAHADCRCMPAWPAAHDGRVALCQAREAAGWIAAHWPQFGPGMKTNPDHELFHFAHTSATMARKAVSSPVVRLRAVPRPTLPSPPAVPQTREEWRRLSEDPALVRASRVYGATIATLEGKNIVVGVRRRRLRGGSMGFARRVENAAKLFTNCRELPVHSIEYLESLGILAMVAHEGAGESERWIYRAMPEIPWANWVI